MAVQSGRYAELYINKTERLATADSYAEFERLARDYEADFCELPSTRQGKGYYIDEESGDAIVVAVDDAQTRRFLAGRLGLTGTASHDFARFLNSPWAHKNIDAEQRRQLNQWVTNLEQRNHDRNAP